VKIKDLVIIQKQSQAKNSLPPLQKKVIAFFDKHSGEVFWYGDNEMLKSKELGDEKASAVRWAVWALENKGMLSSIKVGRKTYFGLPNEIQKVKSEIEAIKK
jgi:hypothetical protein